jgi:hypothetical protein
MTDNQHQQTRQTTHLPSRSGHRPRLLLQVEVIRNSDELDDRLHGRHCPIMRRYAARPPNDSQPRPARDTSTKDLTGESSITAVIRSYEKHPPTALRREQETIGEPAMIKCWFGGDDRREPRGYPRRYGTCPHRPISRPARVTR